MSTSVAVKTAYLLESSGSTGCPTAEFSEACESPPINNNGCPEAVTKHGVTGKNEQEKLKDTKDTNLLRHRVSENGKVLKDQRVEGKSKMGNRRNSVEMVRRSIKGAGIGNNSKVGHLAVGVAS